MPDFIRRVMPFLSEARTVDTTVRINLDPGNIDHYRLFLRAKTLPKYRFVGRTLEVPAEYAGMLGLHVPAPADEVSYEPLPGLFDYQEAVSRRAIRKRKFCTFVEPGYGKTLMEGEFVKHAARVLPMDKAALIVAPLMVVEQSMDEYRKFYGSSFPIERIKSSDLADWTTSGDTSQRIGITNFESLKSDVPQGRLGCLCIDESSTMKSQYGKHGQEILRLGRGLEWKLAGTGTPAPNDRIEFANHAVFMDAFPTVNSFLARFFINRGQTCERWSLKPHALAPFYKALSHWSIFLTNPATYGWKDNAGTLPPVNVHIHDVDLSMEQRTEIMDRTGDLFGTNPGGITSRSTLSQISKGNIKGRKIETHKPEFIRRLVESWPDKSTLIWCIYNAEQESLEKMIPGAASIKGDTPYEDRKRMIDDFKAGRVKTMISKGDVLGFGLNLQVATKMIFSGLEDSYETYWQCVKRANRVGSTEPLDVHIPITAVERPMIETVLTKARRIQADTEEQERLFKETSNAF